MRVFRRRALTCVLLFAAAPLWPRQSSKSAETRSFRAPAVAVAPTAVQAPGSLKPALGPQTPAQPLRSAGSKAESSSNLLPAPERTAAPKEVGLIDSLSHAQRGVAEGLEHGSNADAAAGLERIYSKLGNTDSDLDLIVNEGAEREAASGLSSSAPGTPGGQGRSDGNRSFIARLFSGGGRILPPLKTRAQDFWGGGPLVPLAFLWNFLTMASYSIIGPVKNALFMNQFEPETLPWVYMASALATFFAVWGYSRFTHVSRRRLIGVTMGILSLSLFGWWALALLALKAGWISFGFYVWADVFGSMTVTLFWTYMNDIFSPDSAKRVFGTIGAGSSLGAMLGFGLDRYLAEKLGLPALLLISALMSLGTALVFALMERLAQPSVAPKPVAEASQAPPKDSILRTIFASRFLVFLALLVLLERMVPDFSNYIFGKVAHEAYPSKEAMTALLGAFGLWQNVVCFGTDLFVTRWALRRLGMTVALMSAAVANLAGFIAFPFAPGLPVAVGYNAAEGMFRYTWFKSAKEATYTTQSKDVKYRVKAFIEMFLYRFARGLAGLFLLILTSNLLGLRSVGVALAGIPLALLWIYSAWQLGREFNRLEAGKKAEDSREQPS